MLTITQQGWTRCWPHGGAPGSSAPKGEANGRYSHGLLTAEAIEERIALSEMLESNTKSRWGTLTTKGLVPEEVAECCLWVGTFLERGCL